MWSGGVVFHPVCGAKVGFAEISWCRSHPSSQGGDCTRTQTADQFVELPGNCSRYDIL